MYIAQITGVNYYVWLISFQYLQSRVCSSVDESWNCAGSTKQVQGCAVCNLMFGPDSPQFSEKACNTASLCVLVSMFCASSMEFINSTPINCLQESEQSYKTAIQHRKKYPDAYFNLGNLV